MKPFYIFLIVLDVLVVLGGGAFVLYYFVFRSEQNEIEDVSEPEPEPLKYACHSDGTCSQDSQGKYDTEQECIHMCDRASCINGTCQQFEGYTEFGTLSECQESCADLQFTCDSTKGCVSVEPGSQGQYSTDNCNNECTGNGFNSDTGMCEIMSFDPNNVYASLSECENAHYTSTCDFVNSICIEDGKYVEGHYKIGECGENCNPNQYFECTNSSFENGISGYPLYIDKTNSTLDTRTRCSGKSEGDECSFDLYGIEAYGTCTYCSQSSGSLSELHCGCVSYVNSRCTNTPKDDS